MQSFISNYGITLIDCIHTKICFRANPGLGAECEDHYPKEQYGSAL